MTHLSKQEIKLIETLAGLGKTTKEIAERLNVSRPTVLYRLDEEYRERRKKRAKEVTRNMSKEKTRERNKKYYPYLKKYMKDRYQNDKEFRERFIGYQIKSIRKRRVVWKADPNLCNTCGRKIKESGFKTCEGCRESCRRRHRKKQSNRI